MSEKTEKYLIAGANGQLGREFQDMLADTNRDYAAPEEKDFDISDMAQAEAVITEIQPTVIINCAAYNGVDQAEKDYENAVRINATGPENLALLCKKHNIFLIHYSSDYVFDGKKLNVYTEEDEPNPINKYGKSKLAGEEAIRKNLDEHLILRLSWVMGDGTQNFLYKLYTWAQDKDTLTVSADEVSVPTYTADIADITLLALDKGLKGLYHLTASGYCSRYDLAKYFFKKLNLDKMVIPVAAATFKTAAKRPLFSPMSNAKLAKAVGIEIPRWEYGVDRFVEMLSEE